MLRRPEVSPWHCKGSDHHPMSAWYASLLARIHHWLLVCCLGSVGRILNSEWIRRCLVRSLGRISLFQDWRVWRFDGHPFFINESEWWMKANHFSPSQKKIHQLPNPQPYLPTHKKRAAKKLQKWQKYDSGDPFFHVFFRIKAFLNHAHGIPCHSLSLKSSPFE